MEATTAKACKFILTTYNDGKNNKFYDSTFRIRPPFPPNSNHQYKVTINECLFNNNEPTLIKDVDYFEFEAEINDGSVKKQRFTINKDIITNIKNDDIKIIKALRVSPTNTDLTRTGDDLIQEIRIYNENLIEYSETNQYISNSINMSIEIKETSGTTVFDSIKNLKMRYSTNFGYLFNNLRASDLILTKAASHFTHTFDNIRLGGPYLYVLKTPLQSTVPTYNAINQGYNVVACVYNTLGYHNQVIQMCSSMEVVSNDLSNLRIELVNDQYEQVLIKSPMYIQITVSNE